MSKESQTIDAIFENKKLEIANRAQYIGQNFKALIEDAVTEKIKGECENATPLDIADCGYMNKQELFQDILESCDFFTESKSKSTFNQLFGEMLLRENVTEEEFKQNSEVLGLSEGVLKDVWAVGRQFIDVDYDLDKIDNVLPETLKDDLSKVVNHLYNQSTESYIAKQNDVINDTSYDKKFVNEAKNRVWAADASKKSEELLKDTAISIARVQYADKNYSDKDLEKSYKQNYSNIKSNENVWKRVYDNLLEECFKNGYIMPNGEKVDKYEPVFNVLLNNQENKLLKSEATKNLLIVMAQVDYKKNKAKDITSPDTGVEKFQGYDQRHNFAYVKNLGVSAQTSVEQIDAYKQAKDNYKELETGINEFCDYLKDESKDRSNKQIVSILRDKVGDEEANRLINDAIEKQQKVLDKSRRGKKNIFNGILAEEDANFYADSLNEFFDREKVLESYKRKVYRDAAVETAKIRQLRIDGNLNDADTLAFSMSTAYSDFKSYESIERTNVLETAKDEYEKAKADLENLQGGKLFKRPAAENLKIVREFNQSSAQKTKLENAAVDLIIEHNKNKNTELVEIQKTNPEINLLPEDRESALEILKTAAILPMQNIPKSAEELQSQLRNLERNKKALVDQQKKQQKVFNEAQEEVNRQVTFSQDDETTKKQTLIVSKQKEIEECNARITEIEDKKTQNNHAITAKLEKRKEMHGGNVISTETHTLGKSRVKAQYEETIENKELSKELGKLKTRIIEANKIIAATQTELKAAENAVKAEVGYDDKQNALNNTNGLISQNNAEIEAIRKKIIEKTITEYSEAQKDFIEKEQAKKELDSNIAKATKELEDKEKALDDARKADKEIIVPHGVKYSFFKNAANAESQQYSEVVRENRTPQSDNPEIEADKVVDIKNIMTPDQRIDSIIYDWWSKLDKSKVFDQNGSVVDREYYTQAITQITLNKEIEQLVADESYNFNRIAISEEGYNKLRNRIANLRNNYDNTVNEVRSVGASDFDRLNENDRIKFLINRRDLLLADNLKDINNPTNEEIVNAVKKANQQEYILDKVNNVVRNNIRVNAQTQQPARQPQVSNTAPQMGGTRTVKGFAGFVPSSYSSLEAQIALYNKVLDVYNSLNGITMGRATNVNAAGANNTGASRVEPKVASGNPKTDESKNIPDASETDQNNTQKPDKKPPQTEEPQAEKPEETYASSVTNLASDALFIDLRKNLIDVGGEKGIAPIGRVMADIVRIASPEQDDDVDLKTAELRMREICENTAVNAMVKNIIDEKLKGQTFANEQDAQKAAKEALMDLKERPAPYKNLITGEDVQPPSLYEEIEEEVKGNIDEIFSGLTSSGKARYTLYQATQGKFNEKFVKVSGVNGKYEVEFSGSKQSLLYGYLSSKGISFNVSEYQKAAQKYLNEDMKLQTALAETTGKAIEPSKKVEVEQLKDDMGKPINKYAVARYNKGLKILVESDKDGKVLLNEKDKQYNIIGLEINKDATKEEKEQAYDDMKDISEKVAEQVADEREKTIGDKLHEGEEITDENKELVESDRAKVRNAAKVGTQQNGNTADQYKAGVAPINSTPSTPSNDGPNM